VVAVTGPVLCVPPLTFAPVQPPEAVQDVALVELHVNVDAPPLATDVGFATSETVGAGTTETVAVTILLEPPMPVQINEYDAAAVTGPVLWLPLVALVPPHPPEAVHEVALVEFHVSVEAPPLATELGFADSAAVAAATTATFAVATLLVPPRPLHVNEYEAAVVRGPVLCVPLVALMPLQFPDATHMVAFVELHVSVDAPPLATVVGFAVTATVGAGVTATVAVATLLVPPPPVQIN
jgi:hypothetical protein